MANAIDILEYLPNSYKTRDEQDYINFLWESFESNYHNAKYPFAFIAYHMLYMSFRCRGQKVGYFLELLFYRSKSRLKI